MKSPFHNMAEVYIEADKIRNSNLDQEGKDLLLFALGCLPNQGRSTAIPINGEDVEIDCSIAPIISALNNAGYVTLACCSGMDCDHKEVRPILKPTCGYVAFSDTEKNRDKLASLPPIPGVKIEWGIECYLQPAINVHILKATDSLLLERWTAILNWFLFGKGEGQPSPSVI